MQKEGKISIWQAAMRGDVAAIHAQLENGTRVDAKDPQSFGYRGAAMPGSPGGNPLSSPRGGKTPLYCAVAAGHLAAAQVLLDAGAHLECRYSGTRLVNPSTRAHPTPVRSWATLSAEAGSFVEIHDGALPSRQHGLLHVAAVRGDVAMAELLIENTADVCAEDTGACGYNRPCAHQYVGKYQSCMVENRRLIPHASYILPYQ